MKSLTRMSLEDIPIPKLVASLWRRASESKVALSKNAVFAVILISFLSSSFGLSAHLAVSETDLINFNPESKILKSPTYDEEILWFARLIYSETKDVNEQVIVAWVARNRVENGFRGNTYKEVALSPSQFSGLNAFDHNYQKNINLGYEDSVAEWRTAIEVAKLVYGAPDIMRPFPQSVMHFYSPVAIRPPAWAQGRAPVHEIKNATGGVRFAFFDGIR